MRAWRFLDKIPYRILVVVALAALLAPFHPMPHTLEKWVMLKDGTFTKAIDVFYLLFHLSPGALLLLKLIRERTR